MTRIPGAIWQPATHDPVYPDGKHYSPRSLDLVAFVVYHDAQGFRSYLKQGQRPGEEASWLATVLTDGTIWQHYELEQPTWTSGNEMANRLGVAVEHENIAGNLGARTTDAQVQADAHIFKEVQKLCPNLRDPILGQGFQEHRLVAPGSTSCPNDRIRWNDIAALLSAPIEEDDMELIRTAGGRIALQGGCTKAPIGSQAKVDALISGGVPIKAVSDAYYDAIPDEAVVVASGSQLTAQAIAKEVADETQRRMVQ